jgi:hypothetical protein
LANNNWRAPFATELALGASVLPPGRVAVIRYSVLVELGVPAAGSAELDGLYEQIGVDLMASETADSPVLYYVCPERFLD